MAKKKQKSSSKPRSAFKKWNEVQKQVAKHPYKKGEFNKDAKYLYGKIKGKTAKEIKEYVGKYYSKEERESRKYDLATYADVSVNIAYYQLSAVILSSFEKDFIIRIVLPNSGLRDILAKRDEAEKNYTREFMPFLRKVDDANKVYLHADLSIEYNKKLGEHVFTYTFEETPEAVEPKKVIEEVAEEKIMKEPPVEKPPVAKPPTEIENIREKLKDIRAEKKEKREDVKFLKEMGEKKEAKEAMEDYKALMKEEKMLTKKLR